MASERSPSAIVEDQSSTQEHRLCLLRHAKSSWKYTALSDHDRPLNGRGRRNASALGHCLADDFDPLHLFVSSATRAQETFSGLSSAWPGLTQTVEPALYTFEYRDLLHWISRQTAAQRVLGIIGHNPAFEDLANYFLLDQPIQHLPTCGWLVIDIAIDSWQGVTDAQGLGTLIDQRAPKTHL